MPRSRRRAILDRRALQPTHGRASRLPSLRRARGRHWWRCGQPDRHAPRGRRGRSADGQSTQPALRRIRGAIAPGRTRLSGGGGGLGSHRGRLRACAGHPAADPRLRPERLADRAGRLILEKLLTWSDPATRGKLAADDLLTTVMIYWVTETIGSSIRLYALPPEPFGPDDVVTVPTSVLAPHEPKLPAPPETWLRRVYPKLSRFVMLDEGGHFLA